MNYADIVTREEMKIAREWTKRTLAAWTARGEAGPRAEVRCVRQGWGDFKLGRSIVDGAITLAGRTFETGFGTHADSEAVVTLSRPGERLVGFAGVDDNKDTRSTPVARIVFSIEVGGRDVWTSGRMALESKPARFDVDLGGATEFTLKALGPDGIVRAHADWAGLVLTFDDGSTVKLGEPGSFASGPCFGFTYDGRPAAELLPEWDLRVGKPKTKGGRRTRRLEWTDPKTKLACILDFTEYLDFPVVEWVLHFRSGGTTPTPILEDIRSMDQRFDSGSEMLLHLQDGDYNAPESYQPHKVKMTPGTRLVLAPEGGRPTNKAFPYFNIEVPGESRGVIAVVGWPGQWSAEFTATKESRRVVAGQERTHFRLMPGEEARTPMSALMFYGGSRVRSQNLWRRWMLAHNVPRPGGKLPRNFNGVCMGLYQDEAGEKRHIDTYLAHGARMDCWWMDAGWYPVKSKQWWGVGTWEPDPERFPNGIRAVSDYAHARGMITVLWFEPERVTAGTWLWEKHPEWLISSSEESASKLLDLGNPEARRWLTDHVDRTLDREGIDVYRQDHNFDPLPYWRAHDAEDRQGITEIRCVEGYLAFWDELRRRRPGMLIDTCASGGRRNDLETLRRSVPLLRSDYQHPQNPSGDPQVYAAGNQGHTWGFSNWVPYSGTGVGTSDTYIARSYYTPMLGTGFGGSVDSKKDWAQHHRVVAEWRRAAPLFAGDYYPLTPWSVDLDAWIAWQFHRPDLKAGVVQVFRRPRSPFVKASFRLEGLDAKATYRVVDMDHPKRARRVAGETLMESGLGIELADAPSSAVIIYEKDRSR